MRGSASQMPTLRTQAREMADRRADPSAMSDNLAFSMN